MKSSTKYFCLFYNSYQSTFCLNFFLINKLKGDNMINSTFSLNFSKLLLSFSYQLHPQHRLQIQLAQISYKLLICHYAFFSKKILAFFTFLFSLHLYLMKHLYSLFFREDKFKVKGVWHTWIDYDKVRQRE